ncbi:hypothetical protein H5V45_16515 [Nocardioides sp. KIGAM211]|uniref:Uncharacterized protein n=1 Tax=Nocardioides luti TaxID=2761101 RepID=A0A7X0VD53_9ACTN|nr:hypothetical protein [Nocardioides luti]MBB6628933.1 hypothetical protein [Nocardioides luti]
MWFFGGRKERRLAALEELRQARHLVDDDVTVFGEQLAELHVDTLTTELDPDMRWDYQKALDLYDDAKRSLAAATDAPAVRAITPVLDDGRFHLACVLARRDGVALPERREPCFFNPQHGPAVDDVLWTPPQGVERSVPVCRSDLRRLQGGEEPEVRLVRVGDRYVPWYAHESAASERYSAHLVRGRARLTEAAVAEASIRAGINTATGGGMGGFPI